MPRLIRVVGVPRPKETHRWQTIARARNEGLARATVPWVMFLDDDVILDSGCVRRLADGLRTGPGFAVLAADYLGESTAHGAWSRPDRHIARGADPVPPGGLEPGPLSFRVEQVRMPVLLRRPAPPGPGDRLSARGAGLAQPDRGRPRDRMVVVIVVGMTCPSLPAGCWRHSTGGTSSGFAVSSWVRSAGVATTSRRRPSVMAFIPVNSGSWRERRVWSWSPADGGGRVERPPIRRLRDFADVVASWPEATPAAYWDAGDVIFQNRLAPLWTLVRSQPGKLLAVGEPVSFPQTRRCGPGRSRSMIAKPADAPSRSIQPAVPQ